MTFSQKLTRRSVLQGSALAGALTATAPLAQAGHHGHSKTQGLLSAANTILFQGDSITDAGRDKKNEMALESNGLILLNKFFICNQTTTSIQG